VIDDAHFDRFETKKYRAKNPLQRLLIRRFATQLSELYERVRPASVLEIGCGEGFLSGWLSERHPEATFCGIDLRASDLEKLKRHFPRIRTEVGSAYDLSPVTGDYDLVICAEVLEHLEEPERALRQITALHPRNTIITVPHEPWFMLSNLLRGKNITRLGNDPEHVNHWTAASFRSLLERHLTLDEVTTSYPWILTLGKPR
jgi:SAM-dependent methyltransferase